MNEWTLEEIEQRFMKQRELLKNLADEDSFDMIFGMIEKIRKLRAEGDKLTTLNRHYYHKFYGGSLEKMKADNNYLLE